MAYKPREGETMTVVYADEQTAGRGQGSNHWESEPGKNLTFSVLVHPTMVPVMRQFLLSLIETRLGGGHVKDCVYGTGVDVNQEKFVSDAPNPVSMKQILGHDVDLKELLNKIIDSFKKYYAAIENGEYAAISELYHSGIYRAHGFHRYKDKDGEFEAAIVEVEDSGNLILRDREGCIRSYAFKEVASLPSIPKGEDI